MFITCLALILIMVTKRWTPIKNISKEVHFNLIGIYISAGADLLDLTDYGNRKEIVDIFGQVEIIYGKHNHFQFKNTLFNSVFNYFYLVFVMMSSVQLTFVLTQRKKIDYQKTGFKLIIDFILG